MFGSWHVDVACVLVGHEAVLWGSEGGLAWEGLRADEGVKRLGGGNQIAEVGVIIGFEQLNPYQGGASGVSGGRFGSGRLW